MKASVLKYLQNLLSVPSPSGYEEAARAVWRTEVGASADRVYGDTHGNSVAVLNEAGAPRVMLAGHIDEIGFQVTYVNSDGYIGFRTIGGFDLQIIPGRRVVIHTVKGPVKGVVGKKAIHLMKREDRDKPPELKDLWIDIGVDSDKKAKKLVAIGDPITYADQLEQIRDELYVARGVDDRIGAFVVGEVIRYLKGKKLSAAVYSVATVQEEIGLRGARTSAFGVDPSVAFAVDVTHANGPGVDKRLIGDIELGKGCVVERGANFNGKLFDLVMTVAKKQRIDAQVCASPGGTGTDANAIQLTRAGVATSLISVPTRYMHTPVEMFHLHDVECTVKLIAETIMTLTADSDFVL